MSLRQYEPARTAFETVLKNYPDTTEALLSNQAKQKLDSVAPAAQKRP
jgi:TolA-binding protein